MRIRTFLAIRDYSILSHAILNIGYQLLSLGSEVVVTECQGYVLHCGRSLTALARSCGDAFRGSVGGLSEQHRTVLQYVMRIAITQTQSQPQSQTHTQTQTHDYTPSPSVSQTPNSGSVLGPAGVMNTPNIHTEAPSPVLSPIPVSVPLGLGGLKFDVSPSTTCTA